MIHIENPMVRDELWQDSKAACTGQLGRVTQLESDVRQFLSLGNNESDLVEHMIRYVTIDETLKRAWLDNFYLDLPYKTSDEIYEMFSWADMDFDTFLEEKAKGYYDDVQLAV